MNNPTTEKLADLSVQNAALKEKLICKRCGFDNSKDEPQIDKDIVKDYYKAMLAQKNFEKKYNILNDTWHITCTEPSRKLVAAYANCWNRLDTEVIQYALDLQCLLVISKIEFVGDNGLTVKYETSMEDRMDIFNGITTDNIENVIPRFYQELPQVILLAIRNVATLFNTLCLQLSEEALNENFWRGVGLN